MVVTILANERVGNFTKQSAINRMKHSVDIIKNPTSDFVILSNIRTIIFSMIYVMLFAVNFEVYFQNNLYIFLGTNNARLIHAPTD